MTIVGRCDHHKGCRSCMLAIIYQISKQRDLLYIHEIVVGRSFTFSHQTFIIMQ